MPLEKIDEEGHYTAFPGLTVVAGIADDDLSFRQEIYNCIASCDLARDCFSPLPVGSYHMTAINLSHHLSLSIQRR